MADRFEKACGNFGLEVTEPSPRWVRINWQGVELVPEGDRRANMKIEDLHDLRFLIDRALTVLHDRPR